MPPQIFFFFNAQRFTFKKRKNPFWNAQKSLLNRAEKLDLKWEEIIFWNADPIQLGMGKKKNPLQNPEKNRPHNAQNSL